jgi:hypothetical protein
MAVNSADAAEYVPIRRFRSWRWGQELELLLDYQLYPVMLRQLVSAKIPWRKRLRCHIHPAAEDSFFWRQLRDAHLPG